MILLLLKLLAYNWGAFLLVFAVGADVFPSIADKRPWDSVNVGRSRAKFTPILLAGEYKILINGSICVEIPAKSAPSAFRGGTFETKRSSCRTVTLSEQMQHDETKPRAYVRVCV